MALENLAAIANALGTKYEDKLYHQFNRSAETLAVIAAEPAVNKVPAWDAEFSSSTAPAAYAEGSDINDTELTTDTPVPATLAWGLYRTGFKLSQTEVQAALASKGSPEELVEILGDRLLTRGAHLASIVNKDLFTGTGVDGSGNPTIIGFHGGAMDATGTYATISRTTYPEWAGNVLSNGGVPRPLTVDLLAQAEELVYRATGQSFNFMCGSTGVRRKYQNLFEGVRRVQTQGTAPVAYATGPGSDLDFTYSGVQVRRDKDAPSGKLVIGLQERLLIRFLVPIGQTRDTALSRMERLQGVASGGRVTATSIPFQITPLAKTGNNVKFMLDVSLQLLVKQPNAFCIISDIAET